MGCKHTCPLIVERNNIHRKQTSRISPGLSQRDVSQVTTLTTDCTLDDVYTRQPRFTELQVDIINSTWPIIASDLETQGVLMFLDLFRLEPDAKQMFDFR